MKFSERWLREWVNPEITTQQLVEQITMAGLEVDSVESVAGNFTQVVVVEVISIEPHPNADKLQICQVATDNEKFQIVCGAKNVHVGGRYPLAQIGAQLPELTIKPAKLRGVDSQGMLCSTQELGITEEAEGLMALPADAPLGLSIRDYLQLDDVCIDIDLTPNRGDCLSIRGLAREIGVLNNCEVTTQEINVTTSQIDASIGVTVAASKACPRYVARVITGINNQASTPIWMQEKLRRSGIRSIHPVVDITNYVMLELGQPMHAFDQAKLVGGIQVRMAEKGEKLDLLDGQFVELNSETLIIADHEKPIAMAGIMGGNATSVTAETKNIILESAFFSPLAIVGRARQYGLHTDSSHRFERGVDHQLQDKAIERATELMLEIVGGQVGPLIEKVSSEDLPESNVITLYYPRIQRVLGISIAQDEVKNILKRLGLVFIEEKTDQWLLEAPSYRFDLTVEEDLLEEIVRVYGYDNVPASVPLMPASQKVKPESHINTFQFCQALTQRGYSEAITYSFVDRESQSLLDPDHDPLELSNPIASDMAVMRTSLWPGLIKALQYNLNRQQNRVRLFETGLRFKRYNDQLIQELVLSGVVTGSEYSENWRNCHESVDFYMLKNDLNALFYLTRQADSVAYESCRHPALHPGRSGEIMINNNSVGLMGQLHPKIQSGLGHNALIYLFELKLDAINSKCLPAFHPLSPYPEIRRDIAVVVDTKYPVVDIINHIKMTAGEYLQNCLLFDLYTGKGIDPHRKSIALGLTWQHPSRTLNDTEIEQLLKNILTGLKEHFNAELRQ